MEQFYQKIEEASTYLQTYFKKPAEVAIILGTGLGQLVDEIVNPIAVSYQDIPHFPTSTVKGHSGRLVMGEYKNHQVIMMEGRFHYYEGYSMKQVVFPIYVLKMLGVKTLIVTNSCGGINEEYQPGDLVLINDFISLVSNNPLIGINDERLGPRFPDMSEPYKFDLINKVKEVGTSLSIPVKEGVYGFFSGPYYETRAEIQAFKRMGCDLIGMSTVPETIAANHAGMSVLAIACVTNMATGIQKQKHSHDHVVEVAKQAALTLAQLIDGIFDTYDHL